MLTTFRFEVAANMLYLPLGAKGRGIEGGGQPARNAAGTEGGHGGDGSCGDVEGIVPGPDAPHDHLGVYSGGAQASAGEDGEDPLGGSLQGSIFFCLLLPSSARGFGVSFGGSFGLFLRGLIFSPLYAG
jgi:hypothetical protein